MDHLKEPLGSASSKTSQHASNEQQTVVSEDLLKQQNIGDSEGEEDASLSQVQNMKKRWMDI